MTTPGNDATPASETAPADPVVPGTPPDHTAADPDAAAPDAVADPAHRSATAAPDAVADPAHWSATPAGPGGDPSRTRPDPETIDQAPPIVHSEPSVPPVAITSPTAEAVTWPVRVASEWSARLLVIAAAVYVTLRILERISLVVFAFILAIFFTAVLHPLEARLRGGTGNRTLTSAVVLLSGLVVFGLVGWFVVQQISSHSSELSDQVNLVADRIRGYLRDGPFHVRQTDLTKFTAQLTNALRAHQGQVVSGAFSTAQAVLEIVGGLLLALLSAFFLLRDGRQIWNWVLRLLPRAARQRVDYAGERGWFTLGGYVRGQVTIAFIHATTIFLVLLVLRIPLAAALGVLIFLGSFIPILGLTITGTLCVGVALLEHGVTAAIVVAVAIIVLVQLEGNLLQPLIMARAVHIHPMAVALTVAAGTTVYGIVGALIAVPLVAFLNSFIRGLRAEAPDPVTEAT